MFEWQILKKKNVPDVLVEAILIHIHNICFYGEISKIINLYHFHFNPRLPLFLLYVRWKSGVTFVWRCFCDVCPHQVVEKCIFLHKSICCGCVLESPRRGIP